MKEFLKRKNIVLSAKRYGIDALGAMAQGLFCSLLIGTIIKTLGRQLGLALLVEMGGFATAMSAPAMAVAIGYALQAPPLVLFSLAAVGQAANAMGGAGGPLAVLFIAILAAEIGTTGTPSMASMAFTSTMPPLPVISSIILSATTIGISISSSCMVRYRFRSILVASTILIIPFGPAPSTKSLDTSSSLE